MGAICSSSSKRVKDDEESPRTPLFNGEEKGTHGEVSAAMLPSLRQRHVKSGTPPHCRRRRHGEAPRPA